MRRNASIPDLQAKRQAEDAYQGETRDFVRAGRDNFPHDVYLIVEYFTN
jgi:hypothetical protein